MLRLHQFLASSSGTAKRSRPQNSGVDSPAIAKTSKRQRGARGLERVVSLSTVLQCVDTRADKEGSFDAAVGQRPATVHEVTEGTAFHVPKLLHAIMLAFRIRVQLCCFLRNG